MSDVSEELEFALKFLVDYPKVVNSNELIELYRVKVEPCFRWNYVGSGVPRRLKVCGQWIQQSYQDVWFENYPRDWSWRSFLVKASAKWTCQLCRRSKSSNPMLEFHAHHEVELALWRNAGAPFEPEPTQLELAIKFGKSAPHDLTNLICLCRPCHENWHGIEFEESIH